MQIEVLRKTKNYFVINNEPYVTILKESTSLSTIVRGDELECPQKMMSKV
jgi:hypothetical protein